MSWIDCQIDSDYEIYNEFPFYIRKKSNGKIIKESLSNGYIEISLNRVQYKKHRLVAIHFLPNDQPLIKTEVDHINRDRTDYHLENLRWVTARENQLNRTSTRGVNYEFIDYEETPDDLVVVDKYNNHEFEDYYYSPENNLFYFDNGVNLRVLHVNFDKKYGTASVYARNTEGKQVKISFTKFKRLYGFD